MNGKMKACHFKFHKQVFYFNLGFFRRFRPTSFSFCPAGLTGLLRNVCCKPSQFGVCKAYPYSARGPSERGK
jgi:hypothetical protein